MKQTQLQRVTLCPARVGLLKQFSKEHKYTVRETTNTINPRVRDILTEPEVQGLIDRGVVVTITAD